MDEARLVHHTYGKAKIRILRVRRDGPRHGIRQTEVAVMLEGDFAGSYTRGDNGPIVATDSMKNMVYALARRHIDLPNETFAAAIGRHLLSRYGHVARATVRLIETPWRRLTAAGREHPHTFVAEESHRLFAEAECGRDGERFASGIRGLVLLKTTGSGFAGFVRDEFTTLAETDDRILATSVDATWRWRILPPDPEAANRTALETVCETFAVPYSAGVQQTLYAMGRAILAAVPETEAVELALPNIHYLPVDLSPFGLDNPSAVFQPTEAPHGEIRATVGRP